jgi:small GTP-binding protein
MPANLTPAYYKAQERYRAATEPREQLAALKEMLQLIPKHKGTEHMQADLKKKIKEAKLALQQGKKQRRGPSYAVPSHGKPQVVVLGAPNAGKSALVAALSGTELTVEPYPYTTREPHPAMMPYENARLQLVDMPPVAAEHMEPWIGGIVRGGDGVLLVVDLAAPDVLEGYEAVLAQLERNKIMLGELPEERRDAVGWMGKRTVVAGAKCDAPDAAETLDVFIELSGDPFVTVPVSVETGEGLEDVRRAVWGMLDLVRAIPKPPHQPPDYEDPILLPRGGTVQDMARVIHRDLATSFKQARVWGCADHADGQWIGADHVVEDGEIFEFHA